MGSWGFKPWENDTAADFCDKYLEKIPITALIQIGLESPIYEEVRIAAWLLRQIGINFIYPNNSYKKDIKKAIARIEEILRNQELLRQWCDPNGLIADLYNNLEALKERIES